MLALTFQIGAERLAIDVRRVRRVIPRLQLAPTPVGSKVMAGAFVYRGRVVPVLDLHRLAGAGECPPHLSSRIILVPFPRDSENLVGLLATQVADIREFPEPSEVGATPTAALGPPMADGTGILRLLNVDRLLDTLDLHPGIFAASAGTGP